MTTGIVVMSGRAMASTHPEDIDREFIVEVARRGLTDLHKIFLLSANLGLDRNVLEQEIQDHKESNEALGKRLICRWYDNNTDLNKFQKLRAAFEEMQCGGVFESVQKDMKFQIPEMVPGQMELSEPADSLDKKFKKFLEALAGLIASKQMLMDVGIFGGCSTEVIDSAMADNAGRINQAGTQIIQYILKKEKGTLRKKVHDLQIIFKKAKKIEPFNRLLRKHGIDEADLTHEEAPPAGVAPEQPRTRGAAPEQPRSHGAAPEQHRSYGDGAVCVVTPLLSAVSTSGSWSLGAIADTISREGEFDEQQVMQVAAHLTNPTVESVRDGLRSMTLAHGGNTQPKELQQGEGESGYSRMPYSQQASSADNGDNCFGSR